ncbi:MAG: putative toxin-antitoxin system toxin component, PIN family [Candidatus Omnitrophica bacterium]|nr:putative toxin-antitoxin system toxin component, PIN family [Candidatus Omnitrophota bacterium]
MKILFDTNVIISSILTKGSSFDVVIDAVKKHDIFYTEYIIKEVKETLSKKFDLSLPVIHSVVELFKKYGTKGEKASEIIDICRDPNDNQILADALLNKIDMIISGDKDLTMLKKYQNILIIPPAEYWKII